MIALLQQIHGIEIVGEAIKVDEAMQSIEDLKPDIVILDIKMPGNGINVLKMIKKKIFAPKVIIFTNYPYPEFRKKCFELGADYFFDKSFELEKLIKILKWITPNFNKTESISEK